MGEGKQTIKYTMRKIHYADDLEERVGKLLNFMNVNFVHESEDSKQTVDFYLPEHDVYLEVKKFNAGRTKRQLENHDNIILLQGSKTISLWEKMVYEN